MKQLAKITVIMSADGHVVGACCKTEEPELQKQSYDLCSAISSHNISTSDSIEKVFADWYSRLKTVAGTIMIGSPVQTRVANTSRMAATFDAILV